MELLLLEKDVLNKLLEGDHPILLILRNQLSTAKFKERNYSGSGFLLDISVDDGLAIPEGPSLVIGDVGGEIFGLEYGAGFLIFIDGGKLSTLEGASYAEEWPKEIAKFKLHYLVEGKPSDKRDTQALSCILSRA